MVLERSLLKHDNASNKDRFWIIVCCLTSFGAETYETIDPIAGAFFSRPFPA